MKLGNSIRPRTGYDNRNSSKVNFNGPAKGLITNKIKLPVKKSKKFSVRGFIVDNKGNLIIVIKNSLISVNQNKNINWKIDFDENKNKLISIPILLENDQYLLLSERKILIVDCNGKVKKQKKMRRKHLGIASDFRSPNITNSGEIVFLGAIGSGTLFRYNGKKIREIGKTAYGYDIGVPSIFSDDSLGVCGYSYLGYIRITDSGEFIWETGYKDVEAFPTINEKQYSAAGKKIFDPDGKTIACFKDYHVYSEFSDDEWIAINFNNIARVKNQGDVLWNKNIKIDTSISKSQPLIDKEQNIFFPISDGLLALNKDGEQLFKIFLNRTPEDFGLIEDGKLGILNRNKILVVE